MPTEIISLNIPRGLVAIRGQACGAALASNRMLFYWLVTG
jgi:hypothetical protein